MQQEETVDEQQFPYFGYSLIRDVLLPDLLGNESDQILYWSGKVLARKYPLPQQEDLLSFFLKAGWGILTVTEEKRRKLEFALSGDVVEKRLKDAPNASFHLEAGFIAEQIQLQKNCIAESYLELKGKQNKVLVTVKWDKKDIIE
ncbi:YslB family protein [Priestia abyssalis]|uniref:YslB family protein n=1 Tax=Priestia abyssalis TaxID=1221450 RepID=UPI0009956EA5|nr:YslB family protein [Priestia abyssalis]